MREGFLTLGVILLVLGAIFYFVPESNEQTTPPRLPWLQPVALWGMLIGALVTLLGLFLPDYRPVPEQALMAPAPPDSIEPPQQLTKRERRKIKIRSYRRQP